MADEREVSAALKKLARDLGVFRPDLAYALQGELSTLRDCWSIITPEDSAEALRLTQRSVTGNLLVLIDQLQPRRASQSLTPQQRIKQYRAGIRAYFNIPFPPDEPEYLPLRGKDLTRRREWLETEAPEGVSISVSAGQDDQAHAISQMAAKIASVGYVPVQLEADAPLAVDQGTEDTPPKAVSLPASELVLRSAIQAAQQGDMVYRQAAVDKVFNVLAASPSDGVAPIYIWGEPGTGKTILAHHFFVSLYAPTAESEMPPIALLRAGDQRQLRDDIISLLVFEGMHPTDWSDSYAQAMVRQWFGQDNRAQRPRVRGIVIDGLDDDEIVTQLIPDRPRIPYIITMRKKPSASGVASVRLEGFSEEESLFFINKHLDGLSEKDAYTLANLLAGRPLALGHAVRFIRESPDVTASDVIDTVGKDLEEGLSFLADSVDSSRNLAGLYKMMLEAISHNDNVRCVLDGFLAITGWQGTVNRDLLFYFLNSEEGGRLDRTRFRSALRTLDLFGLISESSPADMKIPGNSTLDMHSLTFVILRELCGIKSLLSVQGQYYLYLANLDVSDASFKADQSAGQSLARHMAREMKRSQDTGLPDGMHSLLCLDRSTWVCVMEPDEARDGGQPHIIRYEYYPASMYKIDSRTAVREDLTRDEAYMLLVTVRKFAAMVRANQQDQG